MELNRLQVGHSQTVLEQISEDKKVNICKVFGQYFQLKDAIMK